MSSSLFQIHSRSASHSAEGLPRYHSAKQYKDVFALPSILESHTRTPFPLGDPVWKSCSNPNNARLLAQSDHFLFSASLKLCFSRLRIKNARYLSVRALFGFGGERGIRTPGGVTLNGFQDRRNRPLCHLSGFAGAKLRFF